MRSWTRKERSQGARIALVPTMGALHDGHLTLVREAAKEGDRVITSIFVNPTQFGPGEDFEAYPRTLDDDVAKLTGTDSCDVVFAPSVTDMYPLGANRTWVTVDGMGDHLCGSARPGHFKGVTTIVARLFTACEPDVAVFGMKDAQQFFILQRMTREMGFGVTLKGIPTVREPDGLAMSSRNRYLTADERAAAPILQQLLQEARKDVERGVVDSARLTGQIVSRLEAEPLCRVDYVQVVDTDDLQPVNHLESGSRVLLAVAAFFGSARLIDNVILDVP